MLICSRCPVLVRSFRGCGVNILSSNPTLIRFNENSQHVSHLTVELVFVVVAVARWCCCCSVVVLLSAGGGASCGASPWNWFGHIQWAWSTYTHTQPLSCVGVCVFLISSVDTVKSGFFFFSLESGVTQIPKFSLPLTYWENKHTLCTCVYMCNLS